MDDEQPEARLSARECERRREEALEADLRANGERRAFERRATYVRTAIAMGVFTDMIDREES